MEHVDLLHEGLTLMALGMGFVFVFLTVLVIVTTLMSKSLGRLFPEPVAATGGSRLLAQGRDDDVMVAISASVHRYRRRHRR